MRSFTTRIVVSGGMKLYNLFPYMFKVIVYNGIKTIPLSKVNKLKGLPDILIKAKYTIKQ